MNKNSGNNSSFFDRDNHVIMYIVVQSNQNMLWLHWLEF
jgi:hypothetical protein